MFEKLKSIKAKLKNIFSIGFFLLAIILVSLMMPRERRFRYEFSVNKPWSYETYTAKFDFPIYKTDDEISAEQDSLLKDQALYFSFDAYQFADNLNKFKEDFDKLWIDYSLTEFKIADKEEYLSENKFVKQKELQQYYHGFIYDILEKIYLRGILALPEAEGIVLDNVSSIVVVRGNIAEEKDLASLLTLKQAYEYITNKINEVSSVDKRRYSSRYLGFFKSFSIEDYLEVNVLYDAEATQRERLTILSESASTTKGRIQQGELIIAKGEIVTQEKYQILSSLQKEYVNQLGNVGNIWVIIGTGVITIISFLVLYMFFFSFRKEILSDLVKLVFVLFIIVLMLAVAYLFMLYDMLNIYYIIPFTILPVLLRTFYDERVALFVHIVTILLAAFIAPNSFEFVLINVFAGMIAIFSLTNLYRRSRYILSAFLVSIAYALTYFGISAIQEGGFSQIEWNTFIYFGINGAFGLISFPLIYVFEKLFGFLSDTTLMELSDTNQPLLRKLAEVAPGTFQHSMQVANLSEEAIRHIGGNPLLVRTGALYHDIGKIDDPIYFIENQTSGFNPHEKLEFPESARKIIGHVEKGLEIAKKYKLPDPIVDFIQTHHGTTTVQYFYKSYIRKYPELEINIREFQYPGPRPSTKECAVVMMADAVEAASRSLPEYTDDSINNLVESIIDYQLIEGQFELANITYRDISMTKQVFKVRLKTIYHARISYPE